MLKERQQKEAAKTCGDSYFPFTSDKTVYAVQHPGSVNFIWKSSLCKFTFAMIITPITLISYVKPLWCPHGHFGIMGMGQHKSPVIRHCFILQYIHDSLSFHWQIHHAWLAVLVSDIPWLPRLQSETVNAHLCYSPFNVVQSWTITQKETPKIHYLFMIMYKWVFIMLKENHMLKWRPEPSNSFWKKTLFRKKE